LVFGKYTNHIPVVAAPMNDVFGRGFCCAEQYPVPIRITLFARRQALQSIKNIYLLILIVFHACRLITMGNH